MIKERWFLGLTFALLVSLLVGYFLLTRPAVYQAQTTIFLDQNERILDIPQVVDTGLDGAGGMWRIILENHINQLHSQNFRNYVADSFTDEEERMIVRPYLPEDDSMPVPSARAAMGSVEVQNVPGSFLLRVRVRHHDPEAAALIANRYAERYIQFATERREVGNVDAIDFLRERAEEFRQRVNEAEEALQEYRSEHNLVSVEDNQNLVAQRLNSINASLTDARLSRLELEGRLRQVEKFQEGNIDLRELGEVLASGTARDTIARLDQLRQEREVMSERYLERHPRMIENERAISAAENLIRENVDLAIADLRNRLDNARNQEATLQAELREAEEETLALDRMKDEYSGLRRAAEGARQTHSQILDRLNEMAITSRLQNSNIRIVDRANVPGWPVDPDRTKIAMLLFFLGGFIFVGTPIGIGLLDHKFKAAVDVETFLGEKLVGEISALGRTKEKERPHVVEKGLNDQAVESFRGLFSQLQLAWDDDYPRALMTTSTIPGEGKSFLVSNLGYCFSAHGKKTLLVDFDLRRPTLHRLYGLPNKNGILPWLDSGGFIEENPLDDQSLGIVEVLPNLFVLPSGGATKKATEKITHPSVTLLIETLKRKFDLVMIDSPPIGIFPDAVTLARLAQNSLYLVRFGKVDRRQVKSFIGRLEETGTELIGVVMNDMPRGRRYSHYYSGYGYGNYKYESYYAQRSG